MQQVMVHIDTDLGPIGGWSFNPQTRKLRHFYPESLDLSISGRARQLMAERPTECHPFQWFTYLATLGGGLDRYEAVEVADNLTLLDVVTEYRRVWNSTV